MKETAYFDNAATTFPKPEAVYSFMDKFYREYGGNVGRGTHKLAQTAGAVSAETRKLLLELFQCPQKQVIFSPSVTESINVVLQGQDWHKGDVVYISPFEHNAVTRVIHYLKAEYGINVVELSGDKDALALNLEAIKYQFQESKPKVVIVSHASNVCGTITPIKKLFDLAKSFGAITMVDMAQTAGLIQTNLTEVQADFAFFAGHKTLYGPFGIGGFISDKNIKIKPLILGGTGIDSANQNMPDTLPERYEAGSQNILAIAGLNAALKWINETGIDNIVHKEKENHQKLLSLLGQYRNIKVIGGDINNQIGVVSCLFEGYSSDNIGQVLGERNVAVRTGLQCAPVLHKFIGTFPGGTVRLSVSYFTNDEDFVILKEALDYIEMNG